MPNIKKITVRGTTYDVVGEIGDPQLSLVKDTVGWTGKNLLPYPSGTRQVVAQDGTITNNSDMYLSDFIELDCSKVIFSCDSKVGEVYARLAFYTSAKVFISRPTDGTLPFEVTVPETARYVRVCFEDLAVTNYLVNPMLRSADVLDSTYEPYHADVEQTLRDAEVIEGKNLLPFPYVDGYSKTDGNITYTVDENGVVDANGTANANTQFLLWTGVASELYKFNGCVLSGSVGGSGATYFVEIGQSTDPYSSYALVTNSETVISGIPNDSTPVRIRVRILNGTTLSHVKFYPMIRYASETDAAYEPYYIPLKDSKFDRAEQRVLGAKNLLKKGDIRINPNTDSITVTDNGESGINISGSKASGHWTDIYNDNVYFLLKANVPYKLSCNGIPSNVQGIRLVSGSSVVFSMETGQTEAIFTPIADLIIKSWFTTIAQSAEITSINFTYEPMLRLASDPDDTYVPYAMTNKQLTDAVQNYIETSTYTDSSGTRTFAFTDARITTNGRYDFYCNVFGVAPDSVSTSNGSMSVNFKTADNVTICGVEIK